MVVSTSTVEVAVADTVEVAVAGIVEVAVAGTVVVVVTVFTVVGVVLTVAVSVAVLKWHINYSNSGIWQRGTNEVEGVTVIVKEEQSAPASLLVNPRTAVWTKVSHRTGDMFAEGEISANVPRKHSSLLQREQGLAIASDKKRKPANHLILTASRTRSVVDLGGLRVLRPQGGRR